ncbi:cell wall-binding repeat-containing protein [Jeotgalibacillus proteolyticus]|uniref:cell wall-binding repeat-containing protein n=1 Tax=Jeotgalibacillus proteolyticus TaxID=2082395 RepID=UPI003CFAEB02
MNKTKFFLSFVVVLMFLSVIKINSAEASSFGLNRISGEDRYSTAVAVSKSLWKGTSSHVVLAVGNNFPDALAGAPLAHKLNSPILLTAKDSVNASTMAEIKRLQPKTIVILGGKSIITANVESQLKNSLSGVEIDRISGENRAETSAKIAERIGGSKAIVVNGQTFADSLSIAAYAARNQQPILLANKDSMHTSVSNVLKNYTSTYVVGGTIAISDQLFNKLPNATRLAGKDRYETSAKVVQALYPPTFGTVTAATGQSFADALTGSTYAAKKNQPIVLVKQSSMPQAIWDVLKRKKVKNINVIGGKLAIQASAFTEPKPPAPKPAPKPSPSIKTSDAVVSTAKQYLGVPYLWGGTTPSGFDCSGFLGYVLNKHDVYIPRTTAAIWDYGIKVSSPKIGDIVMFETYKPGASHGGIYIGNNQFIHSGNDGVEISSLNNSYWKAAYIGAVDVINK